MGLVMGERSVDNKTYRVFGRFLVRPRPDLNHQPLGQGVRTFSTEPQYKNSLLNVSNYFLFL